MPQPPAYDRQYNLTEYATANPSAQYDASKVDAEFDAVENTLDQVLINLSMIQRDDGALANGSVTTDALSTSVAALLAATGSTIRGAWLTATAYALKDVVTQSGITYICATAHTSDTFATDLAAARWVALNSGSTIAAGSVTNTPAGNIAATNVQTALNELDTEKLSASSNLSDVANAATAVANLFGAARTLSFGLSMSGARFNEAQGADVASASTINLDSATGNLVDVTGTTSITAITLSQGREAVVRFTGVLTLTNGASLVLPGGANITTAAGDFAVFRGYAAGVVRCSHYLRFDGSAVNGVKATLLDAAGDLIYATGADTPARLAIGTARQFLRVNSAATAPEWSRNIELATPVTASGTSVDFTGIPAGVRRITVTLAGISTNGTSLVILRIGSGSVDATGYLGSSLLGGTTTNNTTHFGVEDGANAGALRHGQLILTLVSEASNTWVMSGIVARSDTNVITMSAGSKALAGAIDRVRLTTVGGADTFDAGTVNIAYE